MCLVWGAPTNFFLGGKKINFFLVFSPVFQGNMEQSIQKIYQIMRESSEASEAEWEPDIETVKSEISRILTAYKAIRDYSKAYTELAQLIGQYTGNIDLLQEASGETDEDIVKFLNDVVDK